MFTTAMRDWADYVDDVVKLRRRVDCFGEEIYKYECLADLIGIAWRHLFYTINSHLLSPNDYFLYFY